MATTKPLPTEAKPLSGGKSLAWNDYIVNGLLNSSGANSTYGITAAGTNQATATQLNSVYNQVDTVAANTGVNLPLSTGKHNTPYQNCYVINNGANTLNVYGYQGSSDTINGTAGSTAITIPAGSTAQFISAKGGAWFTGDVGETGSFTNLTVTGNLNLGSTGYITPTPVAFLPASVTSTTGTTLTAAQVGGGFITRTGPTAVFSDTLPLATSLFSALGAFYPVGTSEGWFYVNSTAFTATLLTNTGITLSGVVTVPPFSSLYLQLSFTSATAATITGYSTANSYITLPEILVGTADNGTSQTLTTAMVTGGSITTHVSTGGSTPSLTMPLATAIIAAIPGFGVGDSYLLRFINSNSGTATIVTNTGITTTGTLTLATNTTRDFAITMTGAATLSMVSVGTGTNS